MPVCASHIGSLHFDAVCVGFYPGILDQGAGVLVVFDETLADKTYEASLETIQSMGKVVDGLYVKTKKLT